MQSRTKPTFTQRILSNGDVLKRLATNYLTYQHVMDTPLGQVTVRLHDDSSVEIFNCEPSGQINVVSSVNANMFPSRYAPLNGVYWCIKLARNTFSNGDSDAANGSMTPWYCLEYEAVNQRNDSVKLGIYEMLYMDHVIMTAVVPWLLKNPHLLKLQDNLAHVPGFEQVYLTQLLTQEHDARITAQAIDGLRAMLGL